MGIKKTMLILIICGGLLGMSCTVWAASSGGAVPKENGQSEIWAGVIIDYMRKLKFQVLEEETNRPISDASVEIYVPGLDRFVLFGVTSDDGIYELEVVNSSQSIPDSDQFAISDGNVTFRGSWLRMSGNNISYQIYKAKWLPYPKAGVVDLNTLEAPQMVTVYLHKETGSSGGGGGHIKPDTSVPPSEAYTESTGETEPKDGEYTGALPKTGVGGISIYLVAGLMLFLFAGGILWYLAGKERE